MTKDIYPKDFIKDQLIEKMGKIVPVSPYMSFSLICGGIEFLGKCIDSEHEWCEFRFSKVYFENAIVELFPKRYHSLAREMYLELRCGMIHMSGPGTIIVTQNSNDPFGELRYSEHPRIKDGRKILVIEYFYFDFVEACKKVLSMNFNPDDKMNTLFLRVGPLAPLVTRINSKY